MTLKLKNVTIKNFMSVGNVTQALQLSDHGLTLVLGDNLDQGSNGNRNGAGKTVILHAISFVLFGDPLTNIKRDNLINKTNNKNMLVSIEFEKNGKAYKIERGRKPNIFKYIIDGVVNEATDDAQGDSRETQEAINEILGFSPQLFKHIIAFSTKTLPFLKERAKQQREIIEELLGITQLSKKADMLREFVKQTKLEIEREEYKLSIIKEQNEKTNKRIIDLEQRSVDWEAKKDRNIEKLERQITQLMELDIDGELESHSKLEDFKRLENEAKEIRREIATERRLMDNYEKQIEKIEYNRQSLVDHRCHACGQTIHDKKHGTMLKEIEKELAEACEGHTLQETQLDNAKKRLENTEKEFTNFGSQPNVFYNSVHEAYEHKSTLDNLIKDMEREVEGENPYIEQIDSLKEENLNELDYDYINELSNLLQHQEFLLKILTDKKSWVRMQIIEQNLGLLNFRLDYYTKQLGLPHTVRFVSDLSVEITNVGQSFDFDNLSTGESTRLVLALNWAFRDVFEAMYFPINLMFIDELVDSGMDSSGGENALAVLKHVTREKKKNVFLISHKDEFVARVSNVLMVTKENGFTEYKYEADLQI